MRTTRTVGLALALIASACGDDDGGGGRVSSGLPPNDKLSALDSGDAAKLCMSLADSFNNVLSESDRKRIACTVLALPLSLKQSSSGEVEGDVAMCKQLVTKCMNGEKVGTGEPAFEPPSEFIDESSCSESEASSQFAGCEASVSEFESCASAMLKTLSGRFDIIDCSSLSDPEKIQSEAQDSEDLEIDKQPECKALVSKCPDVDFGSGEEESFSDG